MNPKAVQLLNILEQRKNYIKTFSDKLDTLIEASKQSDFEAKDILQVARWVQNSKLNNNGESISMWTIKTVVYSTSALNSNAPALYANSKEGKFEYFGVQIPSAIQEQYVAAMKSTGMYLGGGVMNFGEGVYAGGGNVVINKEHFILNKKEIDMSALGIKRYDESALDFKIEIKNKDEQVELIHVVGEKTLDLGKTAMVMISDFNGNLAKEMTFYESDRHAKDLEFIKCLASDSCDCSTFG